VLLVRRRVHTHPKRYRHDLARGDGLATRHQQSNGKSAVRAGLADQYGICHFEQQSLGGIAAVVAGGVDQVANLSHWQQYAAGHSAVRIGSVVATGHVRATQQQQAERTIAVGHGQLAKPDLPDGAFQSVHGHHSQHGHAMDAPRKGLLSKQLVCQYDHHHGSDGTDGPVPQRQECHVIAQGVGHVPQEQGAAVSVLHLRLKSLHKVEWGT
jgi:hypothetical protein